MDYVRRFIQLFWNFYDGNLTSEASRSDTETTGGNTDSDNSSNSKAAAKELERVPDSEGGGEVCPICWSQMEANDPEVISLQPYCSHRFHNTCLNDWMKIRWSCPLCRTFALPSIEFPPLPSSIKSTLFGWPKK